MHYFAQGFDHKFSPGSNGLFAPLLAPLHATGFTLFSLSDSVVFIRGMSSNLRRPCGIFMTNLHIEANKTSPLGVA